MRYISLKFENIYNSCIYCGFLCFGHRTSANIDSQLYKLWDSVAIMQSDLRSDEDMSFMTYSELQFFLFIIAINHMKNTHNLRENACQSQWKATAFQRRLLFSIGPWFLYMFQFKPKETELHPQYQNVFFVQALCPVSPSRQQSSLPGLQAEALRSLIIKTPCHYWYLSTTYASNGLENWLSLISTNIKLSL